MVAMGLHCCEWASSSCGEWGVTLVALHWLLIMADSHVEEHRL